MRILTIIMLFMSSYCYSQYDSTVKIAPKIKLFSKQNTIVYSTVFLSGIASGVNDALVSYNPYEGNLFWDPYLSWKNQYKDHLQVNGKSFRGRYLAFTTDGYHLTGAVRDMSMCFAVGLSLEDLHGIKNKIPYILQKVAVSWVARTVGHNAAMAVFKNK